MKLVPNARQAWKWLSMQFIALAAALQVLWETLPPDALAVIPADWRGYITIGILALAMIGRLIDQGTAQ
jgi:hypothetical protein